MTMLVCPDTVPSYANAESAMTRSLNGSAFCANNAAACLVRASMILLHHSSRFWIVGAYRVYVSLPRCLTLNGYSVLSSFGGSRGITVGGTDCDEDVRPRVLMDVLVLLPARLPGVGLWFVFVLARRSCSCAAGGFGATLVTPALPPSVARTTGSSSRLSRTRRSIGIGYYCMLDPDQSAKAADISKNTTKREVKKHTNRDTSYCSNAFRPSGVFAVTVFASTR